MFAAVLTRRFFAAALRAVLATVLAQPAAAPSKDDPAACGKGVGDCGTALADCVKKADQDIDAQCECYGPYQKCMDAVKGCSEMQAKTNSDTVKTACDAINKATGNSCCEGSASGLVASVAAVLAVTAARLF